MDKSQSNKLNSYKSVMGVLNDNQDLIEKEEVLLRTVREFEKLLDEINVVSTRTTLDTTGETDAKNLAKEKMARLASSLAASGAAYAFETSNPELEAGLDYSYSDIRFTLDSEALTRARVIEAELLTHKEKLKEYMISEQDLEEFDRCIDTYVDSLGLRGGVKSKHVADVKKLKTLFKEVDQLLLRRLDRLVLCIQSKHPIFFVAYSHARTIIDLK